MKLRLGTGCDSTIYVPTLNLFFFYSFDFPFGITVTLILYATCSPSFLKHTPMQAIHFLPYFLFDSRNKVFY